MGSGVAKQIRAKWSIVFDQYSEFCMTNRKANLLGLIQLVPINDSKAVINIFGQDRFGRDGKCYTDLAALKNAFISMAQNIDSSETIAMPYRIGCGLGGGDWGAVMDMLTDTFEKHNLFLYKF
jgi:O-acetyl-ADP-ribose deacetylase (regulator of RNase III)